MRESEKDSVLQEDLEFIANASTIPWEELNGKSILVTGATGLVGSQLVKALACRNRIFNSNIKILASIRNLEKAKRVYADFFDKDGLLLRPEIEFVVGDIANVKIEENVDYIVHTASVTASKEMVSNPVETIRTTMEGTSHILELAREKQSKGVVYLSSMEAFGVVPASDKRSTEKELGLIDLENPRSCYPEGKRMAECLCTAYASEYKVPVKVARLSQTFGAGITYNENRVFAQFAKAAIEGHDIVLHTKGLSFGNYCYTRDTITALLILLVKGNRGEAYTVANEDSNIRIKDMAKMVAEKIAGGKINVVFDIPESALTYGYAPDTELHLSSAKMQALGWKPTVSLEETYRRMMKSMMSTKDVC